MGLAFLSPWFLLGALAVALPIVLHLRKQDTAPAHAFAAIRFLRRAPVEAAPAAPAARPAAAGAARRGAGAAGRGVRAALHPRRGRRRRRSPSSRWTRRSAWARRAGWRRRRTPRCGPSAPPPPAIASRSSASTIAPPSSPSRASIAARPAPPSRPSPPAAAAPRSRRCGAPRRAWPAPAKGRLVLVSDLEVEHPAGAIADGLTLDVVDVGGPVENLAVGPARREADALVAEVDQPRHPPAQDAGRARRRTIDRWPTPRSRSSRAGPRRCGCRRGCRRAAWRASPSPIPTASRPTTRATSCSTRRRSPPSRCSASRPRGDDLFLLRTAIESGGAGPRLRRRDAGRRRPPRARRRNGAGPPGDRRQRHARPDARDAPRSSHDYARGRRRPVAARERDARRRHARRDRRRLGPAHRGGRRRRLPDDAGAGRRAASDLRGLRRCRRRPRPGPVHARPAGRPRPGRAGRRAVHQRPAGAGRAAGRHAAASRCSPRRSAPRSDRLEHVRPAGRRSCRSCSRRCTTWPGRRRGRCRPSSSSPTRPTRRAARPGIVRAGDPPRPVAVNVDLRESGAPRAEAGGDRRRRRARRAGTARTLGRRPRARGRSGPVVVRA